MKIGKEKYASILIVGPEDEFIASITDEDIILKTGCEVHFLGNKKIKLSVRSELVEEVK